MARTETIDFRSFIRKEKRITELTTLKIVSLGGSMFAVMIPRTAMAASGADATFGSIWPSVLNIVDWLCVGVFVFAGVSWMFGHRTKALELIIGGAAGYILARHAVDIKDWLKAI
ncbi:glycosyltransferase [Neobacillus sp. M.A.Huq-85]